jgi:hypothetical protein
MRRSRTGGTTQRQMSDSTPARRIGGRLHGHLRANAIAYLALFVALGSTSAWAADKITSKEIAKNAVLSKHIKQVKTVDLANGVVTGAKLGNDAVASNNVADNSLATADILNGTIGPADLADGAVRTPNIEDRAVTSAKLADRAVTSAKLADGAVTSAKLAKGAVGFTDYEFVETVHNVNPGDTLIVVSAGCPPGKKLLGGGYAVQDPKFHVTFANAQVNDVYALTASVLPGQTITTTSQAFVEAICARINETP